jgi:predicted aldo/keto reductase-like oxidoreductase
MGMSSFYKSDIEFNEEDMINLIGESINQGNNFFDTA